LMVTTSTKHLHSCIEMHGATQLPPQPSQAHASDEPSLYSGPLS
jgi:hypothetical protein